MSGSSACDRWTDVACHQLRDLGVQPDGALLVHSSLRSLGHVPGGVETVVRCLLEVLGSRGLLLMPALTYASVTAEQAAFDVCRTPCCIGAVAEYFRTRPGTQRSLHPTHSVCGVGPHVQTLLADHHLDSTPCGPRSPYRQLRAIGGQILMLGCGLRPNTSMHAVEELVETPYLFQHRPVEYRVIARDGHEQIVRSKRHAFAGWKQRYDRLADVLLAPHLGRGPVHQATAHLIDVPAMWEAAERTMRGNAYYFVEPDLPNHAEDN